MQTAPVLPPTNSSGAEKNSGPRVFLHSVVEWKDDVEEKLDRARGVLGRLVGNASERETHDALSTASCRDQKTHDDICLGLLGTILIEPGLATKSFRDLSFLNRDSLNVVVDLLGIILDKYHKLTDVARTQLIWLVKEMVKGGANRADEICWTLMRQIAGGDVSGRNLWLAESMLDIFCENRAWLEKYPVLIAAVIYTFLRIIEDHHAPSLSSLRQKEVNFVVSMIREHFTDMCMNQQIGLGRDFLRLLQAVSRIPEFDLLWRDILYNPRSLSPHLAGIMQLLNVRTSRKYLQLRLTPDMEKKINFLTSQVRFGMQKRYQEWFQRQYFSTPESQTLRADIIRYIVGVIHPSNETLCSDILPRWAVIGWLLTTCTNPVAAANAKLALFFDWLVFDPVKDNIMNIEPGILVMYHSLKPHLAITATLLDFLIRLTYEYWPGGIDKIKSGVGAALRTILEKKVLASLDPVLENPKLEPDLRSAIQEHLIVLLDRNNGNRVDVPILSVNSVGVEPNHIVTESNLTSSPPLNILNNSVTITTNNLSALPVVAPFSTPTLPIVNSVNSTTTNCILPNSSTTNTKVNSQQFTNPTDEPEFSDDNDEEEPELIPATTHLIQRQKTTAFTSAGAVPFRSSPTLGSSVEEAERAKIFEVAQTLTSDFRISIEAMLNDPSGSVRSEYLEEIVDELADTQLDKEIRENISKCIMYVYKLELSLDCINEESNSVFENLTISPVNEFLSVLLKLRPSDKSLKMKNLMRILADIIASTPTIGYKILILLHQTLENTMTSSRNEDNCIALYKNLSHYRGLKLEAQLTHDVKCCYEYEPMALGYLCPILYSWYESETTGSAEILHMIVSTIDPGQLQQIVWKIMQGDVNIVDEHHLVPILTRSLEWESWEQHCVWTVVAAHGFSTEDFLPIIPQLDVRHNAEACTSLILMLKREKPTQDILGPLFCRRSNTKDLLVITLLVGWSGDFEDDLAEVLAGAIVRASGSPVKRKRGITPSRGTSSPAAGPPTPTVEQVLGHLDHLRCVISEGGIFAKDVMQAALLQIQSFVTDIQKVRYKELLALAAEEPDSKESRNSTPTKRSSTPRKLPSSPTSSASTSNFGGSVSTSGGSASLSRTRSGRTRPALKDESTDTSDDDDDIPRPKRIKRRKNTSTLNSDSD